MRGRMPARGRFLRCQSSVVMGVVIRIGRRQKAVCVSASFSQVVQFFLLFKTHATVAVPDDKDKAVSRALIRAAFLI